MLVRQIFDEKLAQYAYLVGCPATGEAAIIDPERDVDQYFELAEKNGLRLVAGIDTHIHADYISGLRELAERGVKAYGSDEGDADWKYEWLIDSEYDYELLKHGDTFSVGNIVFEALHTPGHTPEHLSYLIYDRGGDADEPIAIATGDFVFVGDVGRPDLLETAAGLTGTMEAGARVLYQSVEDFKKMPEFLQVWPAHGAGSACGKALGNVPLSTVGYEVRNNASIRAATSEQDFVDFILTGQPEPPLYFARMKRDNKVGPKVLGSLPNPRRLSAQELGALAGRTDVAVVDTRLDRMAFANGHLPGSIYAPLNKSFPTITGSYIEEETPIYLIVEKERVEEAVTDLIRIGLDAIVGYAEPETLDEYVKEGGTLKSTEVVTFEQVNALRTQRNVTVLDVRGISEYEEGHVPGAQNLAHTRLLPRKGELPEGRQLVVHCGTGARASSASSMLERWGHDVVLVNDTFEHWKRTGETTEDQEAVPAAV